MGSSGKKSKKVSNYITRKNTLKARVWEYVEGDVDSPLEYLLLFLIFLNVVALFVSTMVLDSDCYGDDCLRLGDDDSPYGKLFDQIEFISVCIFTAEYLLRIYSCTEDEELQNLGPIQSRVDYCLRFFLVVDFLSVAP